MPSENDSARNTLRYTETILGHLDDLRQEPPCHMDSLTLGVLSERKVAQHLKKGMMPGCVSDIIQVVVLSSCAHALLDTGRLIEGGHSWVPEVLLKLYHT